MRRLAYLLFLLAACGSDDGGAAGPAAGVNPPGTNPPGANPPGTPGETPSSAPECASGTETLATIPTEGLADITVDASYVYVVTNKGNLSRVPRCGGALEPLSSLVTNDANWNGRLAVDAARVFAHDYNKKLYSVPVAGGTAVVLDPGMESIRSIVSDGTNVYLTGRDAVQGKATFAKMPVAGGTATPLDTTDSDAGFGDVTLGGTEVFWSDQGHAGKVDGVLSAMPLAGGAKRSLSPDGITHPTALTVFGDYVYSASQSGPVFRVPKAGGMAGQLASNIQNARAVAVNGTHVYWTNQVASNATVYRLPLAGGPDPEKIADETGLVMNVVAFQKSVFYAVLKTDGVSPPPTNNLGSVVVRITP